MIARKNPSTGKWDAQYSYTDWQGKRKKTTKRGFRTKREAVEWYDHFRATQDADFNMVFKDFIEIYMEDQSHRLRQHTMMNKRFLFDKHKEHNMTYNDLGRWANMRFEFIKQHRPQLYQSLLKENKLHSYLVEFDRQVQDTLILTEEQMRQAEGITEELKRQDQLEWVCRMNNIRSRAEEIVTAELVYE